MILIVGIVSGFFSFISFFLFIYKSTKNKIKRWLKNPLLQLQTSYRSLEKQDQVFTRKRKPQLVKILNTIRKLIKVRVDN
jgi:hypothetical protein